MLGLLTRLVGGAFTPLVDQVSIIGARLLRKAALFLVAGLCLVVVVIALTLAFAFWVSTKYGAIVAALAVAGVYLLVAVVAVVLAVRDKAPGKQQGAGADKEAVGAAQGEARAAGLDAQVDSFAAPLLALLDQLGLRRERFAVMAGASVAKQLGPLPLVGLAIVGGFLVGRMWKTWRALLSADVVASLASGLFGIVGGRRDAEVSDEPDTGDPDADEPSASATSADGDRPAA